MCCHKFTLKPQKLFKFHKFITLLLLIMSCFCFTADLRIPWETRFRNSELWRQKYELDDLTALNHCFGWFSCCLDLHDCYLLRLPFSAATKVVIPRKISKISTTIKLYCFIFHSIPPHCSVLLCGDWRIKKKKKKVWGIFYRLLHAFVFELNPF